MQLFVVFGSGSSANACKSKRECADEKIAVEESLPMLEPQGP